MKPERLSELLSLILNEEVEVVQVIPNESSRITEAGSLLITDILVKLNSGAYANVEIQKVGYAFPIGDVPINTCIVQNKYLTADWNWIYCKNIS